MVNSSIGFFKVLCFRNGYVAYNVNFPNFFVVSSLTFDSAINFTFMVSRCTPELFDGRNKETAHVNRKAELIRMYVFERCVDGRTLHCIIILYSLITLDNE